jgi:glycosyltransferase involved in cell wall biosynthesis
MKKNVIFFTFRHHRNDGGPYHSVECFRKAIGGSILSVNSGREVSESGVGSNHDIILAGSSYYFYGAKTKLVIRKYLGSSCFVFCHKLFRPHNRLALENLKNNGVPYFCVPHGSLDPWVFTYRKWRKWVWLRTTGYEYLRNARRIICATEREAEKIKQQFGLTNTHVINWPVEADNILFPDKKAIKGRFLEKYKIKDRGKLLIYFGRYHSMKRPLQTGQIFRQANCRNTTLLFVGMDGDVSRERLRNEFLNDKNIHVLGPLFEEEKRDLLRAADGYISLSQRENFNYSAAEAMAAGCYCILSEGNDLAHEAENQKFGQRCDIYDFASQITAIQRFDSLSQPELEQVGNLNMAYVRKNLSFDRFAENLQCLLD